MDPKALCDDNNDLKSHSPVRPPTSLKPVRWTWVSATRTLWKELLLGHSCCVTTKAHPNVCWEGALWSNVLRHWTLPPTSTWSYATNECRRTLGRYFFWSTVLDIGVSASTSAATFEMKCNRHIFKEWTITLVTAANLKIHRLHIYICNQDVSCTRPWYFGSRKKNRGSKWERKKYFCVNISVLGRHGESSERKQIFSAGATVVSTNVP